MYISIHLTWTSLKYSHFAGRVKNLVSSMLYFIDVLKDANSIFVFERQTFMFDK